MSKRLGLTAVALVVVAAARAPAAEAAKSTGVAANDEVPKRSGTASFEASGSG